MSKAQTSTRAKARIILAELSCFIYRSTEHYDRDNYESDLAIIEDLIKNKPPQLLDSQAVCDLLQIHPNTLLRWDKAGMTKPIMLTKRIKRYRAADINKLLKERGAK